MATLNALTEALDAVATLVAVVQRRGALSVSAAFLATLVTQGGEVELKVVS
jgi:hypothetical protein